jgi:hypothetical protein
LQILAKQLPGNFEQPVVGRSSMNQRLPAREAGSHNGGGLSTQLANIRLDPLDDAKAESPRTAPLAEP